MKPGVLTGGLSLLMLLVMSQPARAQIETLVMPGKLIEAHAEYEKDCENCHMRFERAKQPELCLACHKDVGEDIADNTGFHGRDRRAKRSHCANCHTDHEGRDADIVDLDESSFDHDDTDFPLIGKHGESRCSDCHEPSTRHRETPSDCVSCHRDDDPHNNKMGTQCGDCHSPTDWLDVEFDHDATGFSLIGKHQEPACLDCHGDDTFSDTPTTCFGCHAEDDAHDGRSGNECNTCHKPTGWHDTSFDHARDTDFPLEDQHAEQECSACHSDDPFSDRLSADCFACHEDDDNHDGHFGQQCDTCHATTGWALIRFDHAIVTGYTLAGAHAEAECTDCHVEPVFDVALENDCLACHEDDEPHEQSLGLVCKECHNESGWNDDVFFDHGLTRFPLLGKHMETDCEECHDTHVFREAPENCVDCHRESDAHDGFFGNRCSMCHNPVDWHGTQFDHDTQTDFKLSGAHRDASCESCHRRPLAMQAQLGRYCADCHLSDDIHNGEFGPDCARCHSADSFRDVRRIR